MLFVDMIWAITPGYIAAIMAITVSGDNEWCKIFMHRRQVTCYRGPIGSIWR